MTDYLRAEDITAGQAYTLAARAGADPRFSNEIGILLANGIDRRAGTTCEYKARTDTYTVAVAGADEKAVASIRHAMSRWGAEAWLAGQRRPAGQRGPKLTGPQVKHVHQQPTDKQLTYARKLAARAGYARIDAARAAMHGKHRVGGMQRQECSELIHWLHKQGA